MTKGGREVRSVYLSFEFHRDAQRRSTFLGQARQLCDFALKDCSLPEAVHSSRWRREASQRIKSSDVVIVLLGPDTHNAPGVSDEVNLARQWKRPIVQLLPQKHNYGQLHGMPYIRYKWKNINACLRDPEDL